MRSLHYLYLLPMILTIHGTGLRAADSVTSAPASAAATQPVIAGGRLLDLQIGKLFIPTKFRPAKNAPVDLLVHFHGDPPTVAREFLAADMPGVLVTVNYPGLSATYAKPFLKDRELFGRILDEALARLRTEGLISEVAGWGKVNVSFFSAGYGAVREILRRKRYLDRIDGLYAADSIYAGYTEIDAVRQVDPANMKPWLPFTRAAAEEEKTFIMTHCYLMPGRYAGTFETANVLIRHAGASRTEADEPGPGDMKIISRASRGKFEVFGCAGTDGQAHMQHLRNMRHWLPRLPRSGRQNTPSTSKPHS